jgi:hypothetical protein
MNIQLNEKKQPLSQYAFLEIPNKERVILSVHEVTKMFPKVIRYFNGYSVDRCFLTFYKKSSEKYQGNALYILQDHESAEEMLEIWAECGYILDEDEDDEEVKKPPSSEGLTKEQMAQHHENLQQIREGLEHLKRI